MIPDGKGKVKPSKIDKKTCRRAPQTSGKLRFPLSRSTLLTKAGNTVSRSLFVFPARLLIARLLIAFPIALSAWLLIPTLCCRLPYFPRRIESLCRDCFPAKLPSSKTEKPAKPLDSNTNLPKNTKKNTKSTCIWCRKRV